jgi:F420-dependent oxidoreductase-like protein
LPQRCQGLQYRPMPIQRPAPPPPPELRRGLSLGSLAPPARVSADLFDSIRRLTTAAEHAGFDALFVPDHVVQNAVGGSGRAEPMLEAYTLLGALATVTERIRLGALVSPVTFRNPALLAKAVTTLDVVSAGRAILGIGAGWDDGEHRSYGFDFPPASERIARLEEAVVICRTMFTRASATVEGKYFSLDEAISQPRPVQLRVPILIGGGGEKLTLRVVARHADIANLSAHDPESLRRKVAVLDHECELAGRDPGSLRKTAYLVPDHLAHIEAVASSLPDLGVDGLILVLTSAEVDDVEQYGQSLQRLLLDY